MMDWLRRGGVLPGMAGLCFAALFSLPAAAKTHHYHSRPPASVQQDDSGYGPTSPGVSTILIDARTGAVLYGQGADVPRYPASLTKLMTLDLAFQALAQGRLTLDTQIPVSYHAQSVEPVKLGLQAGQTISVQDAILAMTTMSANDAATALGEYLGGGSEQQCAQMMTLRAHALGMAQSNFANASGLPNPNQVTTARDLAILARDIIVNYPQFQGFFEVTSFNYKGHEVYSNNRMLKSYAGATGMKTGYTNLARHNLVTSADRNGQELIGVVLHEPSWGTTYMHMTAMLNAGFAGNVTGGSALGVQVASAAAVPALPAPPPAKHKSSSAQLRVAGSLPPPPPAPPVQRVASNTHNAVGGWVAQLGIYTHMARARTAAIKVQHMRGVGVARIAKVQRHGQTLWTAQLAGLSYHAAHETCSLMAARGASCRVLPPAADHLAMLTGDSGT